MSAASAAAAASTSSEGEPSALGAGGGDGERDDGPELQLQRRSHRVKLAEFYGSAGAEAAAPTTTTAAEEHAKKLSSIAVGRSASSSSAAAPLDIDSPAFDPDAYTQKLIRDASLAQLINREKEVHRQIQSLDSDMQTLVYENYNKFISATDTIKKMRLDFRGMEDEMDRLATKMQNITVFSADVSDTLRERRQQIGKLSSTHALLKKLQFLFELPAKLTQCIADGNYAQGVKYYVRAQRVLDQYKHMQSFSGIKEDCDEIVVQLKADLRSRLTSGESEASDMSECVDLLLQLHEPADELCDVYLDTVKPRLSESLDALEKQTRLAAGESAAADDDEMQRPADAFEAVMDPLEFVDLGCNTFLSDLCLVIAAFNETFIDKPVSDACSVDPSSSAVDGFSSPSSSSAVDAKMASRKLTAFAWDLMTRRYLSAVEARLTAVAAAPETTALLVRAVDRFHRRLQAVHRLLPAVEGLQRAGLDLVLRVSEAHARLSLRSLEDAFADSLLELRQNLVAPRRAAVAAAAGAAADGADSPEANLSSLNTMLLTTVSEAIRHQLTNVLLLFIDPDLNFAVKTYFRARFCRLFVRENVLVDFLKRVIAVCRDFCATAANDKSLPPALLLVLSRMCLDLQTSTCHYLLAMVDEQFFIDDCSGLTSASALNVAFRSAAQDLLDRYVQLEGAVLSQMLRKSVETRDWLNTVEPRTVRAVMKRVVEETTSIDRSVGTLYEEGARASRSSDSSRRTGRFGHSSQSGSRANAGSRGAAAAAAAGGWSGASGSAAAARLDTSLASNIQKMFLEKIEIFASVDFSRVAILTGIVKIALKTFCECVRLRTFSKFGFQQIQVDCHYLQLYLWRFVSDEKLVSFLLDEIMTSAVHRCRQPQPMEQSVVEVIVDKS